jgi:hypothetical protein
MTHFHGGPSNMDPDAGARRACVILVADEHPNGEESVMAEDLGSHKGRLNSWVSVIIVWIGFLIGGIAMVTGPAWVVFWIGCAVVVVGGLVGAAVKIFDDTIVDAPRDMKTFGPGTTPAQLNAVGHAPVPQTADPQQPSHAG